MVNNTHPHSTALSGRRRVPGWDFWALTLIGAPAATGLVLYVLNAVFSVQESVSVGLAAFAACGALAGRLAPSGRALPPVAYVLWGLLAAALSAAVPVALFIAVLYVSCHDGGCFS